MKRLTSPGPQRRALLLLALLAVTGLLLTASRGGGTVVEDVTYDELLDLVGDEQIRSAEIGFYSGTVSATLDDGREVTSQIPAESAAGLSARLARQGAEVQVTRPGPRSPLLAILPMLPLLLIGGAAIYLIRSQMGVGRMHKGRSGPVERPTTRFADVAGMPEVIEELQDVVDFLRHPERFSATGARIPSGALLVGPPGTGKTLLSRALAGEAGVPVLSVTGSDFVETFVGVGAARVRELFRRARKEGSAVVFIDEVDAIGRARGQVTHPGTDETERTLNQLLAEIDGFDDSARIFVLAATNRPDILDPALLRAGRFDRRIEVPAPDRAGREAILRVHLRAAGHSDAEPFAAALSARTAGMVGADLENLVNEATIALAKQGRATLTLADLETALERVVMGPERRSRALTDHDRHVIAVHEAGHAVCALLTPGATRPERVTIIPRGGAGGVTWFSADDNLLPTRSRLVARLTVLMGGRAGEEVALDGDVTAGASDDIAKATELAENMVGEWGLSSAGPVRAPAAAGGARPPRVRREAAALVQEAHDRALDTLLGHRALFDAVAAALIAHETLDAAQLGELLERHKDPQAR